MPQDILADATSGDPLEVGRSCCRCGRHGSDACQKRTRGQFPIAVRFETNDYPVPVADGLGPELAKGK
jgi:hypothetical protein